MLGETPVDHIPLTYIEKSWLHTNDGFLLYCAWVRYAEKEWGGKREEGK